jgi:hypothetical protein
VHGGARVALASTIGKIVETAHSGKSLLRRRVQATLMSSWSLPQFIGAGHDDALVFGLDLDEMRPKFTTAFSTIAAAALSVLLVHLATPSMAQSREWTRINGGTLACPIFDRTTGNYFCVVVTCLLGGPTLVIRYAGGTDLVEPEEATITIDGRNRYRVPLNAMDVQNVFSYSHHLSGDTDQQMMEDLRQGRSAEIALSTITGPATHTLSLRGSSRMIAMTLQSCPIPDGFHGEPQLISPEIGGGFSNEETCIATETQLFEMFRSIGGIAFANRRVIETSNAATTEVINRDPFTYRINDAWICERLGG